MHDEVRRSPPSIIDTNASKRRNKGKNTNKNIKQDNRTNTNNS